jgi:transcription termination factor Rho
LTTTTTENQNSEDKPNKRKKISSSSGATNGNSEKPTKNRSSAKSRNQSNAIELTEYSSLDNKELVKIAKARKITEAPKDRSDLINILYASEAEEKNAIIGAGILDILPDQFGFLRPPGQKNSPNDIHVSRGIIRKNKLRAGDFVLAQIEFPDEGGSQRYPGVIKVEAVNGMPLEKIENRVQFDKFTSIYPDEQIILESDPKIMSSRIIDLVSPIGKGQRALVVAPPKAGKTILLKDIANSIEKNTPDIKLIVALIGERPEEVTDMRRSVNGEVFSSTFDEPVEDHCKTSETALERARRLVESGQDVVLLLDSLTRLGRAYNIAVPSSGKTLSGGMDPYALYPPKKFFGAARNCEEGGSLTIIATALVDTGSRLDDLIYEEFKGTGNMELHLDRSLAERRIWPAINIEKSGTRHEELLQNETTLSKITQIRRIMAAFPSENNAKTWTEKIVEGLRASKSNQDFLDNMQGYLQEQKD